jgi:hypothetical protein
MTIGIGSGVAMKCGKHFGSEQAQKDHMRDKHSAAIKAAEGEK